jgi:hypothetical protein
VAWRIVTKNIHGKEYFYAKSSSHKEPTAEKFLGTADDIVAIINAFHNPPPRNLSGRGSHQSVLGTDWF